MADLTDLTAVKALLWPTSPPTEYDTLLSQLITTMSAEVEAERGWPFGQVATPTTFVVDGTGSAYLWLPRGPLANASAVTSVHSIAYNEANPTGEFTEIESHLWRPKGLLDGDHKAASWIERVDASCWTEGTQNYRVIVADYGFATVPVDVKQMVTNEVVAEFATRDSKGFQTARLGDFSVVPLDPMKRADARRRVIARYRTARAA